MKALAYGRVVEGCGFYGRGTPMKALAYGRVLWGGVFYGRGTPVKALACGRVLGGGGFHRRGFYQGLDPWQGPRVGCFIWARYPYEGIGPWVSWKGKGVSSEWSGFWVRGLVTWFRVLG